MAHKTVYLIRHGKTPGNEEKRYIGCRTDEGLSSAGIRETAGLRALISKRMQSAAPVFRVCASPMCRAVETARILFPGCGIHVIPELTEIDFGDLEGANHRELSGSPVYQAWLDAGGSAEIPGGERREAFSERSYRGFLMALGDAEKEERVAIVCHGGNIMSVMSRLTGADYYSFLTKNLEGYRLELELKNEGISVLSYDRLDSGNPD